MKPGAGKARRWIERNRHRADHSEEVVTVGWLRELCEAAVALDDIDAICARRIDRAQDGERSS